MSIDYITKAFGLLIASAGVTRITFHGLRHTHISHQLMDGVHLKIVSERAGHANVSVTLGVYAAFLPAFKTQRPKGSTRGFAMPLRSRSVATRWQSGISMKGSEA